MLPSIMREAATVRVAATERATATARATGNAEGAEQERRQDASNGLSVALGAHRQID